MSPKQGVKMTQISNDIREILKTNISYFATASRNNNPNVVPVGLVEPISDSEILIVDVLFNKTRKNLMENPWVALSVTDINRLQAYQLKGKGEFITSGQLFDRAFKIMKEKHTRRNKIMEEKFNKIQDPKLKERLKKMMDMHTKLRPKAVVLMTVNEIYPTM